VGFAAPITAAAVALSQYVTKIYPTVNGLLLSCLVIVLITVIHSVNMKAGSLFQRSFTLVKAAELP
jgi:APA family basic amino acid/polyamine antiporter